MASYRCPCPRAWQSAFSFGDVSLESGDVRLVEHGPTHSVEKGRFARTTSESTEAARRSGRPAVAGVRDRRPAQLANRPALGNLLLHRFDQGAAEVAHFDRHFRDGAVLADLGFFVPVGVVLVEQEDGGDVAERGLLAEAVEGVEGGAAVGACGEEDDVGGARVFEEAFDGAVGVAEDQDSVAVLFEQLAEHVLHFYVGLDRA